jgi:hypothetical protein
MYIYGMWPWRVPKWLWFWSEVAVKAWQDLATLIINPKLNNPLLKSVIKHNTAMNHNQRQNIDSKVKIFP